MKNGPTSGGERSVDRLNPMAEAEELRDSVVNLVREGRATDKRGAIAILGKSASYGFGMPTIKDRLRYFGLSQGIQDLIRAGAISVAQAKTLLHKKYRPYYDKLAEELGEVARNSSGEAIASIAFEAILGKVLGACEGEEPEDDALGEVLGGTRRKLAAAIAAVTACSELVESMGSISTGMSARIRAEVFARCAELNAEVSRLGGLVNERMSRVVSVDVSGHKSDTGLEVSPEMVPESAVQENVTRDLKAVTEFVLKEDVATLSGLRIAINRLLRECFPFSLGVEDLTAVEGVVEAWVSAVGSSAARSAFNGFVNGLGVAKGKVLKGGGTVSARTLAAALG